MKVFFIWLFAIIIWNFGVPEASPIEDVIVAMLLSLLTMKLKKIKIISILLKNKCFDNRRQLLILSYLCLSLLQHLIYH